MAGNATTVARLRFSFEGDLKGYRESLKAAKSEGDAAAKTAGLSFKEALGSGFRGLTQDLRQSKTPLADIRKELGGIGSAMKTAFSSSAHRAFNAGLGVVKASLNGIKGLIGTIGKGFALGMGFTGFQMLGRAIADAFHAIPDLITKGREYIRVVDDVADATGATAEQTSKFVGTLKYLGVPINGLINMIGQASRNLKLMEPRLQALGIVTEDSNGLMLNQIEILDNARKAMHEWGLGSKKADIIAREFGRGGLKTLVDYLNLTDEQFAKIVEDLRSQGLIVTEEQRNMAEAAVREGARFENAWTGLGVHLFTAVGPTIMAFMSDVTDWIKSHVEEIKIAISEAISFLGGLVSSLLGMDGALGSFSETIESMNQVYNPYSAGINELIDEITLLDQKHKTANTTVADGRRVYEAQIKVVDKEVKALDALVKAEDRVFAARLKGIKSIIDEKLAMMDAAEAARELASQQLSLNEQLNEAQIALAEAQRGEKGKVDADAVAKAMEDVVATQRAIAELAKEQDVAAQRKTLTDAQDYIDGIVKLVEDAEDRKAAAKELGSKRTELNAALALAKQKGDAEQVALLTAEFEAVQTGIEQVNARLRTDAEREALDRKKEMLQEAKAAVTTAATDETAILIAEKKKQLAALEEKRKAWETQQVVIGKVRGILTALGLDAGTILGDPKGPVQGSLEAARLKGIETADALKKAFDGFKTTLQEVVDTLGNVASSLGGLFDPLMKAWEGIPAALRGAIIGALVGGKLGGLPGAVIGGLGGGGAAVIEEESDKPGNQINIGDYNKAGDAWKGLKAQLGRLPKMAEIESAFASVGISASQQQRIIAYWKGKQMIEGWAGGGMIGSQGPRLGMFGERGAEWVISNPALRALTSLNRAPAQTLAAVTGGGNGGSTPVVIRLEIGGRPLLDYMDEHLEYRRRI
jgi:hypothetical protein